MNNYNKKFQEAWKWIWHSDSILSWLVALALAFIIIRFIFFPLLSLALATKLPLVVIESGSMHHSGSFLGNTFSTQGSFDSWWESHKDWYESRNITKSQFEKFPFRTGMEKGDIILVYGRFTPAVGDIIIFNANTQYPIIHRIVKIEQINGYPVYSTKGDNNSDQLYIEKQIPADAILGKSVLRIPKLGWIKLVFVEIMNGFK